MKLGLKHGMSVCGSGMIIRKGYDRDRQRFYCKDGRGFFIRVLSIGDDIPRNKCSENGFRSRI
jgi:transposase-like protein